LEVSSFLKSKNEKWLSIEALASLKGVTKRTIQRQIKKYTTRLVKCNGGLGYEILLSSIESELQEKYLTFNLSEETTILAGEEVKNSPALSFMSMPEAIKPKLNKEVSKVVIPEGAKKIALARLDLLQAWETYRDSQIKTNKDTDKDFLEAYNSGIPYPEIFEIIGKASLATLYRWRKDYNDNQSYKSLIPSYNYRSMYQKETKLTPIEQKYFLDLLLQPNKVSVGNAVRLIKFVMQRNGFSDSCSYSTFKRFADWYKSTHFDVWTLMREGQKALKDKVEPYIKRSPELLEVGDVLVSDGHTLDFEVINPFTGRPCRATLVAYLDWKSFDFAGYEIMITENTQCIASALRNSILRLGKIPKITYQDNGRAFRGKFFTGSKPFDECGFYGLFGNLGIVPVFSKPYNARAKVIERAWREFSETGEKLMPSYTGNSPVNKPAWRNRNEKFHKSIHNDFVPTIKEAVQYFEKWLEFYRAQPCPNCPDKAIGQVFNEGIGTGIKASELDDFMLAQEARKIGRNGVKFLNNHYYADELYGLKDKAIIKYSLFDLSSVRVYATTGEFICEAKTILSIHPMAHHMGTEKDVYHLKQALKQQKKCGQLTMKKAVGYQQKIESLVAWQDEIKLVETVKEAESKQKYTFICDSFGNQQEDVKQEYKFTENNLWEE